MRLAQNRIYSEFCPTEVAEALKIVAHCGLHQHLLFFEFVTRNVVNNVLLAEQFSNPDAAFTFCGTARLNFAQMIHSFAQVIIGQLINRFTFRCLWNDGQAEDIVLARYGGDQELKKVHTSVRKVTCDVCTKLKIPSSYDGVQSVCKHPHRRQINSHYVPFGNLFVSNHNVFIEEYVKIYCRIIVLAHRLRPQTAVAKLRLPKLSAIIKPPSCFAVKSLRACLTRHITLRRCFGAMVLDGLSCNSMFLRIAELERFGAVIAASVNEIICSYFIRIVITGPVIARRFHGRNWIG
jgi:hypothetical protein